MKKIITIIASLLLLSSCGSAIGERGPLGIASPMPLFMRGLPQGSDAFSTGFREGCYHFVGQNGYGLQRVYDYSVEPEYLTNKQYRLGYKHGSRYCGVYINKEIFL